MLMSIWQAVGFHMVIWLAGLQTIPATSTRPPRLTAPVAGQSSSTSPGPGLRNTADLHPRSPSRSRLSGLFTQIDVMTQGGPLDCHHDRRLPGGASRATRKQETAYASAISLVFFVLVLRVALVQRFLTREKD